MADSNGKSSVPSFMRPTASHSSRNSSPSNVPKPGGGKSIDAADLFARDKGSKQGFVTNTRDARPGPKSNVNALRSRPVAEDPWDRVKVFVRVRPVLHSSETAGAVALESEGSEGSEGIAVARADGIMGQAHFKFDCILPPAATQQDVYNVAVRPVVDDVLMGYNGSVMAYGQTGAGKTHTLSNMDPEQIGMTARALADIFNKAAIDILHMYKVYMSYVQIYMEVIKDLLNPSDEQLQIREDANGVFLTGVHEQEVKSTKECLELLQMGDNNRVFASTQMNAHSSRSHAVVMVTVFKKRKRPLEETQENGTRVAVTTTTMGRIFLVDLAGSERLKKSGSVGVRAQEAKHINLSLTTLGMCVNARADPNSTHVPFRDSKLTRLLQESLGGNAKTSMIIAVSDVKEHSDETFHSLEFGSRAILVKTAPKVNQVVDLTELNDKIAAQLEEVAPESALEKALRDRERAAARAESALRREQLASDNEKQRLQRKLDNAATQAREIALERDQLRSAIGQAAAAAEKDKEELVWREKKMAGELAAARAEAQKAKDALSAKASEAASLSERLSRQITDAKALGMKATKAEEMAAAAKAAAEESSRAGNAAVARAQTLTAESEARRAKEGKEAKAAAKKAQEEADAAAVAAAAQLRKTQEAADVAAAKLRGKLTAARGERDQLATELQERSATCDAQADELRTLREALEEAQAEAARERVSAASTASALQASNTGLQAEVWDLRMQLHEMGERQKALLADVTAERARASETAEQRDNALTFCGDLLRRHKAAVTIQQAWRKHFAGKALAARDEQARGWERERSRMSAEQVASAAEVGRALIRASVEAMQGTTHSLLMEMLLPTKAKEQVRRTSHIAGSITPKSKPFSDFST